MFSHTRYQGFDISSLGDLSKTHEGCFYRRRSDLATMSTSKKGKGSNTWSYHNHILQGAYLRYIRRPLSTKEVPSYRLVLVAGKAKGRLMELLLHPESEVTTATLPEIESPSGSCFIVNVSGKWNDGSEQRWQLAMATSQQQSEWVEALEQAKHTETIIQESGEFEKLKVLTRKMLHEIDVRNRMKRFKMHRGVFLGTVAVKWISSELGCSSSTAVIVGNMMLNCGFFYHVGREHIFCDKKLYYRFDSSLSVRGKNDPGMELLTAEGGDTSRSISSLEKETSKRSKSVEVMILRMGKLVAHMNRRVILLEFLAIICVTALLSTVALLALSRDYLTYILVIASCVLVVVCVLWGMGLKKKHLDAEGLLGGEYFDGALRLAMIEEEDEDEDEDEEDEDNLTDLELMLEEEDEEDVGDEEDVEDILSSDRQCDSPMEIQTSAEPLLPSQRRTLPSIPVPPVESWPNRPLLARRSPNMLMSSIDESSALAKQLTSPLHLQRKDSCSSEFPIESDLFVGKMNIMFKNVEGASSTYFRGRKRKYRVLVQGRFKLALPFSSVYAGQVLDGPIKSLPATWITRVVFQLLSKLQPASRVSMKGDKPYFLTPLVSTSQCIDVSRIGQEPSLDIEEDIEEDMSLLGKKFVGMASKRRKAHFSRRRNLRKHFFDPNLVYTFDFFQQTLNMSSFEADIGMIHYDLLKILGSKPIQFMAVAWDPLGGSSEDDNDVEGSRVRSLEPPSSWPYLYNVEILHERSLQQQPGQLSEPTEKSPKVPKKRLMGIFSRRKNSE